MAQKSQTCLSQLLILLSFTMSTLAQTTTTPTSASAAAASSNAFPSMSATDGGGVAAGGLGSTDTGSAAGASGSAETTFGLSSGAIIGLVVGIVIVVIAIIVIWTLWYLAKKKQWNIRESIRRASRRITGRKVEPRSRSRAAMANRRGTVMLKDPPMPRAGRRGEVDLEKGQHAPAGGKPKMGWLADEKERSRSVSREDRVRK